MVDQNNLYVYVGNQPTIYRDPSGEFGVEDIIKFGEYVENRINEWEEKKLIEKTKEIYEESVNSNPNVQGPAPDIGPLPDPMPNPDQGDGGNNGGGGAGSCPNPQPIPDPRLPECIFVNRNGNCGILAIPNANGGWDTSQTNRGGGDPVITPPRY